MLYSDVHCIVLFFYYAVMYCIVYCYALLYCLELCNTVLYLMTQCYIVQCNVMQCYGVQCLADPGEAKGCSINSLVINSLIN